jgi:hypothetical protein
LPPHTQLTCDDEAGRGNGIDGVANRRHGCEPPPRVLGQERPNEDARDGDKREEDMCVVVSMKKIRR